MFSFNSLKTLVGSLALASATPTIPLLTGRGIDASTACANAVKGLTSGDCIHMASIGFAAQGVNSYSDNGKMWIGNEGPNTFRFTASGVGVTLVTWNLPAGDYTAMCMNVRQGQVTYSIPAGQSVTVSVANGMSGAFAGLYNGVTTLNGYGQVNSLWGEFTTGAGATVDVSREVNMGGGDHMSITVAGSGCVSEYTATSSRCAFTCTNGEDACGDAGTYTLDNCAVGSQTGATSGVYGGQLSGGCQGFDNGGHVDVVFYN